MLYNALSRQLEVYLCDRLLPPAAQLAIALQAFQMVMCDSCVPQLLLHLSRHVSVTLVLLLLLLLPAALLAVADSQVCCSNCATHVACQGIASSAAAACCSCHCCRRLLLYLVPAALLAVAYNHVRELFRSFCYSC
jgi:hypothetical protein